MKRKKRNLFIGTLLVICIIVPLFYFTFITKNSPKKNDITLNYSNLNKNNLAKENGNEFSSEQNTIRSSGISDVKTPNYRFFSPFIFKSINRSYTPNFESPTANNVQAEQPGTIQNTTNNIKPIPKKNITRRISPNIIESPNYSPKNKVVTPKPEVNLPAKNNIQPAPIEPQIPITPIQDSKPIENTSLPTQPDTTVVPPTPKVVEPAPIVEKPQSNIQSAQNKSNSLSDVEQAIFNFVNVERAKVGLPLLSYNKTMEKYARIKSKDMGDKNYFSHEDLQGNLITVQMDKDGVKYKSWGENIASRGGSIDISKLADQFMTQWMNSSGHRANILSVDFQSIGVGLYQIGNEVFATQEFYK